MSISASMENASTPYPNVANGIKPTPALFEYFPVAEAYAKAFILDHMTNFTVVMLQDT